VEGELAFIPLSETAIRRGLRTAVIGRRVICVKAVGSTNDWLKAAAAEGAPEAAEFLHRLMQVKRP